jgi:hypothetical protein
MKEMRPECLSDMNPERALRITRKKSSQSSKAGAPESLLPRGQGLPGGRAETGLVSCADGGSGDLHPLRKMREGLPDKSVGFRVIQN